MAVRERQNLLGSDPRTFSVKFSSDDYKTLEDYAWNNRVTLAAAVRALCLKALAAENAKTTDAAE